MFGPFLPSTGAAMRPDADLLRNRPDLVPAGFVQGLAFVNDATTPMELVLAVLQQDLGLPESEAVSRMLSIHRRGGLLMPFDTREEAERVAARVRERVVAAGHPGFVCRVVGEGRQ